jgi:hypothetical protein
MLESVTWIKYGDFTSQIIYVEWWEEFDFVSLSYAFAYVTGGPGMC